MKDDAMLRFTIPLHKMSNMSVGSAKIGLKFHIKLLNGYILMK